MPYQTISLEFNDSIATLMINHPDKLNALNKQVIEDLSNAIEEVRAKNVRGLIITGAGEKAFVAGADISEFSQYDAKGAIQLAEKGQAAFRALETFPAPVIAAVNGFALGGGCELAMACHLRIASENARFGQPEVKLGLIPGYGGTQRLIQYVGKTKALELLMSGDMIKADEAKQLGLVNDVVPQSELMTACETMLSKITSNSPVAISHVITSVNNYFSAKGDQAFVEEAQLFGECFKSEDYIEGTTAFLEKRKPDFKGR